MLWIEQVSLLRNHIEKCKIYLNQYEYDPTRCHIEASSMNDLLQKMIIDSKSMIQVTAMKILTREVEQVNKKLQGMKNTTKMHYIPVTFKIISS